MSSSNKNENNSTNNNVNVNVNANVNATHATLTYSYQPKNEMYETTEEWELTWPIWHMLSRDERKAIAIRHGMKTIGEFEEYMSLHKAEEVSSSVVMNRTSNTVTTPYSNELAYGNEGMDRDIIDHGHDTKFESDDDDDDDENHLISRLSSAVTISNDDGDDDYKGVDHDDDTKEEEEKKNQSRQ